MHNFIRFMVKSVYWAMPKERADNKCSGDVKKYDKKEIFKLAG